MFKPDPSSILLQYPRSNIDRVQDFYEIYNPPEKGWWSVARYVVSFIAIVAVFDYRDLEMIPPPTDPWLTVIVFCLLLYSSVVMCGVAAISKTFMTFGSRTELYNLNPFLNILFDPQRTRSILTGKPNSRGKKKKKKGCLQPTLKL